MENRGGLRPNPERFAYHELPHAPPALKRENAMVGYAEADGQQNRDLRVQWVGVNESRR